jgi:AcrR family transcriptional regulator
MADNRSRVRGALVALAARRPLVELTLADIAEESGVSVRTLLRYYGSRDQLFHTVSAEIHEAHLDERVATPDDIRGSLAALGADHERYGNVMLMLLSQEAADPLAASVTARGKAYHRQWVCDLFGLDAERDEEQVDLLVVATDLYTWKLLRRDRGLSEQETVERITRLVDAVRAQFAAAPARTGDTT